ncbi:hypothetical protein [Propylenella binzhouense]|uniref:Uncharacterized protein n=1 Tax=Propylenella binzhouense TaxID=2555902 RepID=A0A964T509_9HYPH|nr:hypothetical protein [Propylenella binzhouense]MYZ48525.1 hypothetical protein [Propylenella binzhouense]
MGLQRRRGSVALQAKVELRGVTFTSGWPRPAAANDNGRYLHGDPVLSAALFVLVLAVAATIVVTGLRILI